MTGVRVIMDVSSLRRMTQKAGADLGPAIGGFMKRLAILVEQGAEKRLRGSGTAAPRSYPVPIRSGNLRRGLGGQSDATSAMVFNTANYAGAVHAGYRPYGNPKAEMVVPRPFLADAVEDTDIGAELDRAMATVFG